MLAYGRDPYFAGWPDTLQLDYGNPATQEAMLGELLRIGGQCDGVRCDMAMLVLPDVFERTWGRRAPLVLADRRRSASASASPDFCFMAEVYWDLEWTMQQQGFDYAYDKRLYDRLREGHAGRCASTATPGSTTRRSSRASWRTTTSHGPRRRFAPGMHEAAAVVTYLSPGLRFFHQGQFEGRQKRISPHLVRAPVEPIDAGDGAGSTTRCWRCCGSRSCATASGACSSACPAWDGNGTSDGFIAWCLAAAVTASARLVAVNYAGNQSQCYVRCRSTAARTPCGWKMG